MSRERGGPQERDSIFRAREEDESGRGFPWFTRYLLRRTLTVKGVHEHSKKKFYCNLLTFTGNVSVDPHLRRVKSSQFGRRTTVV